MTLHRSLWHNLEMEAIMVQNMEICTCSELEISQPLDMRCVLVAFIFVKSQVLSWTYLSFFFTQYILSVFILNKNCTSLKRENKHIQINIHISYQIKGRMNISLNRLREIFNYTQNHLYTKPLKVIGIERI